MVAGVDRISAVAWRRTGKCVVPFRRERVTSMHVDNCLGHWLMEGVDPAVADDIV